MTYAEYHNQSMDAGDVDPAVACLEYIANRFELNLSQRYWLAFLYGTNYCAPTTFLIYNEFPDFEMVDTARLQRWWTANKSKLLFQTDRLRIKTMDGFVPAFNSYRKAVAGNQWSYFKKAGDWKQCYRKIEAIRNFGRFSTFNYMDVLNRITDTTHAPTYLNMAEAESCRKGLCLPRFRKHKTLIAGGQRQAICTLTGDVFEGELCRWRQAGIHHKTASK